MRDALRTQRFEDVWRVEDVVPGAPAYARRFDAPLVGRAEELERLHAAYVDARASRRCRVVTVVGEAGIGKTRLLREFLMPLREEARVLVGRCVSYGEGATYLPIAEIVRQAARESSVEGIAALLEGEDDADKVAGRIAELTGLAEGPAAPGEAFWAVRRFVEALARDRPVVLVLDDIHWAEPTLLDLVEYLGEWSEAPVLVLCAARRELLEDRPTWGGPTSTGFVVELAPLAPGEVTKLVLGLAEQPVDPDVERRIVEHAGGNPLFAEQLLALATEAPDPALGETPPTVEALLASRLDRLDRRELAVLRRASVVGRRFTREELADLSPDDEAERTDHHLVDLTERALLHQRERVFVFHHVLVRDVAYRGIPKAERADLHELAARGLDRRNGPDEIVGFHYEKAYRCLTDIGGRERARELAASGGERLGRAGVRAWRRADAPAAVNLLTRAVELVPEPSDLVCELGLALFVNGNRELAEPLLRRAVEASDQRIAARGRLELAELRSTVEPDRTAELVSTATAAIPILEAADDERALGRAWLCLAHAHGGFLCEYDAAVDAAEQAVAYYRKAGWSPSGALQHLGAAMYFGAKPVDEAIARSLALLQEFDGDRASEANVLMWLAGLEAMHAAFESARGRVDRARQLYLQLGLTSAAGDDCSRVLGFIELLAGAPALAEGHFRRSCEMLRDRHQTQVLATRAGELAGAFYAQARYDEAESWVALAEETAGRDDLDAALAWQPIAAMLTARRGATEKAELRIRDVLRHTPDGALTHRASTFLALAEILQLAGRSRESADAMETALALFEQKGNAAGASLARALALEEASANR